MGHLSKTKVYVEIAIEQQVIQYAIYHIRDLERFVFGILVYKSLEGIITIHVILFCFVLICVSNMISECWVNLTNTNLNLKPILGIFGY